jgi:Uma2 family endonuclease
MQVIKVPTQIYFSPLLRRYTLEEFWALPERDDRVRYDLIGGYLYMVPPPNPPHGDIGARMNKAIMKFVLANTSRVTFIIRTRRSGKTPKVQLISNRT